MVVQYSRRWFTVNEYHRMAEAGILGEDDRVELIEGEVAEMTPIGRQHIWCVIHLTKQLVRVFGDVAEVSMQNPVALSQYTEPEPDLALLRLGTSPQGIPTAADVLLLIEVADSSVELDRRVKVPLYARSGIAEVWLVDLEQETITVYRDPSPDGYRLTRVARRGKVLAPAAFPDRSFDVDSILG